MTATIEAPAPQPEPVEPNGRPAPPPHVPGSIHGQLWNTMPGWGITANLLPPEITIARRIRVVRKLVVLAIVGVFLLGAGGFAYGYWQKRNAQSELDTATAQTTTLQQQQTKYSDVVTISGQISSISTQLSTLLSADVDMTKLLTELADRAPAGSLQSISVTLNSGSSQSSTAATLPDPSGQLPIGIVTIDGSANSIADVAKSVTSLARLPGVVEVYPTSQQNSGHSVKYTLQLTLVDRALSHAFDVATATPSNGGK